MADKSLSDTVSRKELSYGQQALWFLYQQSSDSGIYNLNYAWNVPSLFDETILRHVLHLMSLRHEVLRSTFTLVDGVPMQIIHPYQVDFTYLETEAFDFENNDFHAYLKMECRRPIDLASSPPIRWKLFSGTSGEAVLFLQVHHVAVDLWSIMTMMNEIKNLYRNQVTQEDFPLSPLTLSNSDFIIWQKKRLSGARGQRYRNFWLQELSGELPVLNLQTDRPRPSVMTCHGNFIPMYISDVAVNSLRSTAESSELSLFQLFLSAYHILLHRHTSQNDVMIGYPTAGRRARHGELLGYYVSPVITRSRFLKNLTTEDFLKQMSNTLFQVSNNQDYPFPLLVQDLNVERDFSRAPLCQASFIWEEPNVFLNQDNPMVSLDKEGNQLWHMMEEPWERLPLKTQLDDFDIVIRLIMIEGQYYGHFEYNEDLFDQETIERMAGHYLQILESICDPKNLDVPIDLLPMISEGERKQLIHGWNQTQVDYACDPYFHEVVGDHGKNRPDAIAVSFEDRQLTYAELNQRANQLAHTLREKGVGPDVMVGISMERGAEMLVTVLAILKAGGAYLPLDPEYPQERLAFMIEDAALSLICTQSAVVSNLPEHNAGTLCVDSEWDQITACPHEAPIHGLDPSNLAYVIYTSGTTGKPKGVQLNHRGLANLMVTQTQTPDISLSNENRTLVFSSLNFDASIYLIVMAWQMGATLYIAKKETTLGDNLQGYLEKHKIDTTLLPPSVLPFLQPEKLPHLQNLIVGGEACSLEMARKWARGRNFQNAYGPTEGTVWATTSPIDEDRTPPIGKPVANTQTYILDAYFNPVPIGVPGELLIGGDGLARGYLNRPELTAQQFIPNPFSDQPGRRLYRSGDLCRFLANGDIDFLGRIDHQVKIRGFRIELGEIEAVVREHEQVSDALVMVKDRDGNKQLAAFVMGDPTVLDESALHQFLDGRLPDYMVPSAFAILESFPLTPNEKIDRAALGRMELTFSGSADYVAPRNAEEETIAGIWTEVLGLERVGVNDSFFELGGHSLLATRVLSRIRDAFDSEVLLPQFFKDPTVAGLAQVVLAEMEGEEKSSLPPISRIADGEECLSLLQQGLWLIHQMKPENPAYNVPFALRLQGELDKDALKAAIRFLVDRHPALRTIFSVRNGNPIPASVEPQQLVEMNGAGDVDRVTELKQLARKEALKPFNLAKDQLFRCLLVRFDADDHGLIIVMHHMVSDGWSVGVFLDELLVAYKAFSINETPSFPELGIRYVDFAHWQRQYCQGSFLEDHLTFWKDYLDGSRQVLELPADKPRPKIQSFEGASLPVQLPAVLVERLRGLGRQQGATLYMTLLTAFNVLLYRYTGHEDILVGSPIAGRNRKQLEALIGFFVNTLVLRTDLSGKPGFNTLLAKVRDATLEAYKHQDVPFSVLVDHVVTERDLSRNPLFQVMFVLQNTPMPELKVGGLEIDFVPFDRGMSHFDLSLNLEEGENGIEGCIEYATALFEPDTIARMMSHFHSLLEEIVAHPNKAITELSLLGEQARREILVDWNATGKEIDYSISGYQMFEQQVVSQPGKTALIFENETLSYEETNRRANQLAHHLRQLGIGPDCLVGISLKRSPDMVICQLAIQKAGGAYVPLDPNYPAERIEYILKEARVAVVLTTDDLATRFASYDARIVSLDGAHKVLASCSEDNPKPQAGPDHLSHVIYTSGSTGNPKGVAIEHHCVTALIHWADDHYSSEELSGVLASTSLNFDISVFETLLTLALGGTTILVENALYLPDSAAANQVRLINTVPSAIKELIRMNGIPSSTITVNLAGEPLKNKVVQQLYRLDHIEKVYNLYGPSEDTTYSTWALTERGDDKTVLIGRPLTNTQAYVLDANLQPVPMGVPGELYLAGDGLARGYLNRPDLTAERFLVNPFESGRIYATGDLVRFCRDGQLECLGRIDHQVKIRGFRIELGEIESMLLKHPEVAEAIVVDREDHNDEKILVGYVTLKSDRKAGSGALREYLHEHLPDYMVPAHMVILEIMPLNPNGKIDRKALPDPQETRESKSFSAQSKLQSRIAEVWMEILNLQSVDVHDNFFDRGGNSLHIARMRFMLKETLERDIQMTDLFQYPTISSLAHFLDPKEEEIDISPGFPSQKSSENRNPAVRDIAVIGLAGRFPKSANIDQFWANLRNGVECITFFSDQELEAAGVHPSLFNDPNYVKANGVLEDADLFDAGFFGYSPREAQIMDPQQRLFIETAWAALEDAGYNPELYQGRIGVYAGVSLSTYLLNNLQTNPELVNGLGPLQIMMSNDKDFMPTRVSYKFNLKGPAVNVQTACSTTLVAIHHACQALLHGDADMILVGGASINVPQKAGYLYEEGGILSPDGHCRVFDEKARGTLKGNGVGVVVLKPLNQAKTDGDRILAVVKGSAINNDGSLKVGYTAPSVTGQAEVIMAAQTAAGIEPASVTYVEAHGTATPMGDPIEVAALTKAFRAGTGNTGFCALGSVKSNMGHLDAAAGIASFIKCVLSLHHKEIPPSLHFEKSNPSIDFTNSPFYVNAALQPWAREEHPRRAGVSSFGIGGTNAHVVLEEAPEDESNHHDPLCQILPLSAKTASALEKMTTNLLSHLKKHPDTNLADVAFTLQTGRKMFNNRRFLVSKNVEEAIDLLETQDSKRVFTEYKEPRERPVVFMFSGQGAQYPEMARELYQLEMGFREDVDRCCAILKQHLQCDLRELMFPSPDGEAPDDASRKQAAARLNQTAMAQPALFVIEYSMARLWMRWGLRPQAMIGHSIGEYTAACIAGVFSLEDALWLVSERGRLMQAQPPGDMMAVPLCEEELQPFLNADVSLAAINGPARCVVAGPKEAIDAMEQALLKKEHSCTRLHTSHAFHSAMMDEMLEPFTERVRQCSIHAPQIPYLSNVTGTWVTRDDVEDVTYWARHLRGTVRFEAGIKTLLKEGDHVFLEVGPGRALTTFVKQQLKRGSGHVPLSSIRHPKQKESDYQFLLTTLGQLWMKGNIVQFRRSSERKARKMPLPTYPFEGRRYWVDPLKQSGTMAIEEKLFKKSNIAEWFYLPTWKRSMPPEAFVNRETGKARWMVFSNGSGLGARVVRRLEQLDQQVVTVLAGQRFHQIQDRVYAIQPGCREDYETLVNELNALEMMPQRVLHLWNVDSQNHLPDRKAFARECLDRGFYSLVYMAQIFGEHDLLHNLRVGVVTSNMQEVFEGDLLNPEKATILGPSKVLPGEYPGVICKSIDIATGDPLNDELLVNRLINEMDVLFQDTTIVYRGLQRWVQDFTPAHLEEVEEKGRIREKGVYLITGGLGGMGLVLAEYLAETCRARLVLVGRSSFPEKEAWQEWLDSHGPDDRTSRKIAKVRGLEEKGAEVLVLSADVCDTQQMQTVRVATLNRFGAVHGVIHTAGTAGGGIIQLKTAEKAEEVLNPKVAGTLVLDEVFKETALDFLVLCSSINAIAGGFGQVDYVSANAFLDAFAHYRNSETTRVISINWDAWKEVGMAVETELSQELRQERLKQLEKAINNAEGTQVFRRILERNVLPQVVVSTRDIYALLEEVNHMMQAEISGHSEESGNSEPVHARPDISTAYVAPETEIEKMLVFFWEEILGVDQCGINDSFDELGGDSLLSIRLFAMVNKHFQVKLSRNIFIEKSTVAEQAEYIQGCRGDQKEITPEPIKKEKSTRSESESETRVPETVSTEPVEEKPGIRSMPPKESVDAYEAPGNDYEQTLQDIFREVIDTRFGVKDDFFKHNQHIEKAPELVQRINDHYGLDFSVETLANEPTLERIGRKIEIIHRLAGSMTSFNIENDREEITI